MEGEVNHSKSLARSEGPNESPYKVTWNKEGITRMPRVVHFRKNHEWE